MISKETICILSKHPRSHWEEVIDQFVFSERDRAIMKRKLLDDITFEDLAEEVLMSPVQVKRIYVKWIGNVLNV